LEYTLVTPHQIRAENSAIGELRVERGEEANIIERVEHVVRDEIQMVITIK